MGVAARTGGMQEQRDTEKEGCMRDRVQEMRDAVLERFRKGGIHERRDTATGKEK